MKKYSSIKKVNSPRSSSVKRTYVGIALLSLLIITFLLPRIFNVVGKVALAPIHGVALWLRVSESAIPYFVRDRLAIKGEIDNLQAKLDAGAAMEASMMRLMEENVTLRAYLGDNTTPRLLARVIGRPPFLPYDLLQIDKGSDDGVEVGAPVFAGRDVVVGVVSQVGSNYAFIELVSTPGFESTVYVSGAQMFGTLEGVGGGVARVRLPPSVRVVPGDLVLLSAYESGIFGQVSQVESSPTQPEQYAYVSLPENLQSVRFLTVGRKSTVAVTPEAADESARALLRSTFKVPGIIEYRPATTSDPGVATTTVTSTLPVL